MFYFLNRNASSSSDNLMSFIKERQFKIYPFSMQNTGHFSMLGLGDIVMPGLLLCFVLRYDSYKKNQLTNAECGLPPPPHPLNRVTYFHCSLIGYFVGKSTLVTLRSFFLACFFIFEGIYMYLVPEGIYRIYHN